MAYVTMPSLLLVTNVSMAVPEIYDITQSFSSNFQ